MSTMQEALAGIEFTDPVPDGELVSDVMLIARCIHAETGVESIIVSANTGISVITQLGLVHALVRVVDDGDWSPVDDDE